MVGVLTMNEASGLTAKPCGDELPLFCTECRLAILTPALRLFHLCITLAVRREQLRIAHMSGAWLKGAGSLTIGGAGDDLKAMCASHRIAHKCFATRFDSRPWSRNRRCRYMQLEGLQTLSDTVPTQLSAVAC